MLDDLAVAFTDRHPTLDATLGLLHRLQRVEAAARACAARTSSEAHAPEDLVLAVLGCLALGARLRHALPPPTPDTPDPHPHARTRLSLR